MGGDTAVPRCRVFGPLLYSHCTANVCFQPITTAFRGWIRRWGLWHLCCQLNKARQERMANSTPASVADCEIRGMRLDNESRTLKFTRKSTVTGEGTRPMALLPGIASRSCLRCQPVFGPSSGESDSGMRGGGSCAGPTVCGCLPVAKR